MGTLRPITLALLAPALLGAAGPSEGLVRRLVAEAALAQVERIDPAWHPQQRDCAGLVRFAYRSAFRTVAPERLEQGLWRDAAGRPSPFADAETLLASNFAPIGRDEAARRQLASGDLLAFRQEDGAGGGTFHLMLVLQPADPAHAQTRVVYHTGDKPGAVRLGVLDALAREAPAEWRPVPQNPRFIGFFRFKEWQR